MISPKKTEIQKIIMGPSLGLEMFVHKVRDHFFFFFFFP